MSPRRPDPAVKLFAKDLGERGQGRQAWQPRWTARTVAGPWWPQLLTSQNRQDGLGEEAHLPGFSRPCRGILGREGRERLCVDDELSRQGTAA